MSVRKNSLIATVAVSGSRVAGLVREVVFAFFFGAGPVLDAFITAFRIPNLLRDLFSEGALSNAFVAVFAKKRTVQGDQKAFELANRLFTFIWVFLGAITLLGIIFSPWIVATIASGFSGEKLEFTIFLNRILFPFILFVSLAALCMGILNTHGKYALPQSASTFFNFTSIVAGLVLAGVLAPDFIGAFFHYFRFGGEKPFSNFEQSTRAMTGMALGTLLGGIVQWLIQVPALRRLGFRHRWIFDFKNSDLHSVLALTGPAILGGAAVQVNVLVNTFFASYLADGSISWLNYAFRLMQFPIGVFGVAIAVATTPVLAKKLAESKTHEFKSTLEESTRMAIFLCVPSALGLIALAEPIISLIYQYGRFTAFDTQQAAHALSAYSVGLAFYALIKIYQPAFLAMGDAKTPMRISFISILFNFGINAGFVFGLKWAHWGLALGTSAVAILNACWLMLGLKRKIEFNYGPILNMSGKVLIAAIVAAVASWGAAHEILNFNLPFIRVLAVLIPISIAGGVYFGMTTLLGVTEAKLLVKRLQSRF